MSEYIYKRNRVADGVYSSESTGEQIVRCRDCKHYVYKDRSGIFHDDRHNDSYCRRFVSGGLMEVEPDGFCAWGKRREGDES